MIPPEFLQELATDCGISDIELEVLELALNGEANTGAIATKLGISPEAVRKRLSEVYRKFDIRGAGPGKLAQLQQKLVSLYHERQTSSVLSYTNVHKNWNGVSVNLDLDWEEVPGSGDVYGRTDELNTLKEWIVKARCRLVAIHGMDGIGKTALVEKLVKEIRDEFKDEFKDVFWYSLRRAKPANSPEITDSKISQLIEYLHHHRYLLVLDDVEAILSNGVAGHYQKGYEKYRKLVLKLGEERHQSCLVLIGLEKPKEVSLLERQDSSVRSYRLDGLKEEASKILESKGLSKENEWERLINLYSGNPLALKIISSTIQEFFGGSVKDFLRYNTLVISDISDLLSQQFQRLSKLEKDLMYCLAIEQKPVTVPILKDLFKQITLSELLEALESLRQRSLIEKIEESTSSFTLQPVILEYVTNQLVEQVREEIININVKQNYRIKDLKIQLLRNHLIQKQTQGHTKEFQDHPLITRVKEELLTIFSSEKKIESMLNQMLLLLKEQSLPEEGYASENVRNLIK